MFNYPGESLKTVAKIVAIVGFVLGTLVWISCIIAGIEADDSSSILIILVGLLMAIITAFGGYVSGVLLAAFGEIVEAQNDQSACQLAMAKALAKLSSPKE